MIIAKPFVQWVGGKRQMLPHLLPCVPNSFKKYYEPFVGGGALFFAIQPSVTVLGDANLRLIRTYFTIRDDVEEVIGRLRDFRPDRDFYEWMRSRDIDRESNVEVAAWFIYLNRTCFNALYRVNASGRFNVPYGRNTNPTICDADNLRACSEALRNVAIYCCDFAATVATADRGDFVYFDPPYIPATATSSFTTYTANGFGMAEHVRLRDLADDLRRRDVEVLLSNSDTPTTRDLYKGWDFVEVRRRGIISCKGDGRQPVGELLIRSRTAPNATGIASKRRRTISRSGAAQG